jgi:predicted metal-dependent hydrolase
MTEVLQFGSKQIEFKLKFSERKTLGITVNPDLGVLVKAPLNTPLQIIKVKLKKRAPWIIQQQSYFLSFQPKTPPRKFVNGESHLYLGRNYQLRITQSPLETIKLKGKYIEVATTKKEKVKHLMDAWYINNAKVKFHLIAQPLIETFKKYKIEPSSIVLREMPTRWGSCTPKGKIILNPKLIKAPKGCIEYVIIHELCHLIHHNHTQKFIDLQTKEMPDWEKWKMKLERLLA